VIILSFFINNKSRLSVETNSDFMILFYKKEDLTTLRGEIVLHWLSIKYLFKCRRINKL